MKTVYEKLKELVIKESADEGGISCELEETIGHLDTYDIISTEEYNKLEDLIHDFKSKERERRRMRMERIKQELNEIKEQQIELDRRQRELERERGY